MENFIIINREDADVKNVFYSDSEIKVLDKDFKTKEDFIKNFDSVKKGTLGIKDNIKYENIESLKVYNDDIELDIKYKTDQQKSESTYIEFNNEHELEELKNQILNLSFLSKNERPELNKPTQNWYKWSILILVFFSNAYLNVVYDLGLIQNAIFIIALLGVSFWIRMGQTKNSLKFDLYTK